MRIEIERVYARLEQLFAVGEPPWANRPGLSPAEQAAIELAAGWMREAGLEVSRDAAGNLFGRRRGHDGDAGEIWCGSHLDTVPAGGRFDGALGVMAAIEAVGALERARRTVTAVAFRDEEGWRFGRGLFGSRATCGRVEASELDAVGADGVTLREALARLGLSPSAGGGRAPGAYLELHIEQGPVLAGVPGAVGVVTGIVGMWGATVTFTGRAGHAGTTPMAGRADALAAAAEFVVAARQAAAGVPDAVATVGELAVRPNASNVIPASATLSIDARAPSAEALVELREALRRAAAAAADAGGCTVAIAGEWEEAPASMSPRVQEALTEAARAGGVRCVLLPSGAGHDAGVLAASGVPCGMLFVASERDGVSHDPSEWTEPARALAGIQVLHDALAQLAA